MPKHVVIIGNGIAGITAARFIRKMSDFAITVVSDETPHFYARTALMYIYMGHLRYKDTKPYEDWFWEKNRIRLVQDYVEEIDTDHKRLRLRQSPPLAYDVLLIATGSRSNRFGWPGQDLRGVQGLYGMPDLERMEADTEGIDRAVVVGGGLIGIEMTEMLQARHIPVTFLVREPHYMSYLFPPEEGDLIRREILEHGVDLRLSTELDAVLPDAEGRVRAVLTSAGEEIPCGFVGLAVGVHPNIEAARASKIETDRGVLVNAYFETNVPDVYAAGDCVQFRKEGIGHRSIEQLWYTGRRHGKTVAHTICGYPTPYDRGVFFNSAKFFSLEYQTYGEVEAEPGPPVGTFLWQPPEKKQLIRINYDLSDGRVRGFNLFGVRFRQGVCERWIREKRSIDAVLQDLHEADFDPEFSRRSVPVMHARRRAAPPERGTSSGRGLLARLFR